jgi:hypothetical protein
MRWIEAAAWPEPMAWPLFGASGSGPRAAQRESKLVGVVGVCAKALQQRTGLVRTARCPDPQVSRIILDCIHGLVMAVASNVVVLSSIKIGAPASREGTWYHFLSYEPSNYCTFAANRHSRCFTELARTSILAIGYSMTRTGKRPIAELGS